MDFAQQLGYRRKVIWVVSAGGHLSEAVRLSRIVRASENSLWITPRTDHALSLLLGARTRWVPYVRPRDIRGALKTAAIVHEIVRNEEFDMCVSTGAAIAAFSLPAARSTGLRTIFVESLARPNDFSLTGKILRSAPGVETFTQYAQRTTFQWKYTGSILDDHVRIKTADIEPRRIFVTLGTIRPYRFDRAINAILTIANPSDEMVWQVGETARQGLPGDVRSTISYDDMRRQIVKADVVITHAGVGSILDVLDAGKVPVLVSRSAAYKEHVDNHQADIAAALSARNLAVPLNLDHPSRDILKQAASARVIRKESRDEQQ